MIDSTVRRRFGQNYLIDKSVIFQIVEKINPSKEDNFIEIGPGKVLSGLIKRINKEVILSSINSEEDIKNLRL